MTTRRLMPALRTGSLLFALICNTHAAPPIADEAAPSVIENDIAPETEQSIKTKGTLPLEELRIFTEIMHRIKLSYVEDIDDKTLLDNAIKGMIEGLDPHSAYLEPSDFTNLEASSLGEFGGLGIEVSLEDGVIKVITPIDETPAQRAGIEAGDLIIKLDGKAVRGMLLKNAVEMMRGAPGEPIDLTIAREGNSKPITLTVIRDIIKVVSVRQRLLESGYGYIRLSRFQVHSGSEVLNAIDTLKKELGDKPLQGLVLDLRNNPGGVLQAAVDVTDTFLSDGLIVYTKGRGGEADISYSAKPNDYSNGTPLVVLINSGSASASEIVAGALQDHHRAVLLGTRSFGKGSVQTVLPLTTDDTRGLKLTTALYYTPNGRSIQAEGIMPDIRVDLAKVTHVYTNDNDNYREADLQGHLENNNNQKTKNNEDQKTKPLDETDYQLSQALNILKGLYINQLQTKGHDIILSTQVAEKTMQTQPH